MITKIKYNLDFTKSLLDLRFYRNIASGSLKHLSVLRFLRDRVLRYENERELTYMIATNKWEVKKYNFASMFLINREYFVD